MSLGDKELSKKYVYITKAKGDPVVALASSGLNVCLSYGLAVHFNLCSLVLDNVVGLRADIHCAGENFRRYHGLNFALTEEGNSLPFD